MADAKKAEIIAQQKVVRIGDEAPNFSAETTQGPIEFHKFIEGKWALLVSHPADFTPVCTTELGRMANLKEEWEKRGVVVAAISVDSAESHKRWIADIEEITGSKVWYPIIGDEDRKISLLYGMLNQDHLDQAGMPLTVRSVFVVGPDRKVKLIITYPAPTGRNFDEIIRVIDSLQLAITHKVATPADWRPGKECVVLPFVPTEEAVKLFPKGVKEVRKWLRVTPDPKTDA